ncbi:MAG: glycosyltransferase family A protein [Pirellulaceae bacterium]|nr:glycosyltransferase family A protein [Pirellulaceae bacterium]
MNQIPQVSIVMPAFESQRYIAQAIRSIQAQTLRDFELIVIDDGSTDRTASIVSELAREDSRIRLFSQDKADIAVSRNRGLKEARAPFVAAMDADDVNYRNRLEMQVAFMNKNPTCVCLGAAVDLCDDRGFVFSTEFHPIGHDQILERLLNGDGAVIRQPVCMVRADCARSVGGYDSRYSSTEDLDLFLRLSEIGTLSNIDKPLLMYRLHRGSVNQNRYELQRRHQLHIVREAHERRRLPFTTQDENNLCYWPPPSPAEFESHLAFSMRAQGHCLNSFRHAFWYVYFSGMSLRSIRRTFALIIGPKMSAMVLRAMRSRTFQSGT